VDNGPFVMADNDRDPGGLRRSTAEFQRRAEQAGPAAGAGYTLIGAIMLLGLIGYGIDRWTGRSPWFLVGGLILGVVVGMYELARTVWKR
jgi:F0F1-type ATP synthase assembly protein I